MLSHTNVLGCPSGGLTCVAFDKNMLSENEVSLFQGSKAHVRRPVKESKFIISVRGGHKGRIKNNEAKVYVKYNEVHAP